LTQLQNGCEHVISYTGRALNSHESNYPITELEALAVIHTVSKFEVYLRHCPFTVYTDHSALKPLFETKDAIGRLGRWILYMQGYRYGIVYKPGEKMGHVDALSRRGYPEYQNTHELEPQIGLDMLKDMKSIEKPTSQDHQCPRIDPILSTIEHGKQNVTQEIVTLPEISALQEIDPDCKPILQYLRDKTLPESDSQARKLLLTVDQYIIQDDILYHFRNPRRGEPHTQVVVPASLRPTILSQAHSDTLGGHFGQDRTFSLIQLRYFWPGMFVDVKKFVDQCISCKQKKRPKQRIKALLHPLPIPTVPFERLSVDIVGPLPTSYTGNKYLLCFTDHLTRYPEVFAIVDTKASTVARIFFNEIVCRHGAPRELLSDRGTNFLSSIVRETCKYFGTSQKFTSPYHPQTNGLQERYHATLIQSLSMYVDSHQKDWDEFLPAVLFAYRATPATRSTGHSPFMLLFGREPTLPLDVTFTVPQKAPNTVKDYFAQLVSKLETVRAITIENLQKNRNQMKLQSDRSAFVKNFTIGDIVFVYTPQVKIHRSKKLTMLWTGPYLITQKVSEVLYRLRRLSDNKLLSVPVHVNRFKIGNSLKEVLHDTQVSIESDEIFTPDLTNDDFEISDPESILPTNLLTQSRDIEISTEMEEKNPNEEIKTTNDNDTFEVEKVLKGRYKNGKLEYLIKWKDYPASQNTWEPELYLNDATLEYLEKHPVQIIGKSKRKNTCSLISILGV
jgi:hypothetical protein